MSRPKPRITAFTLQPQKQRPIRLRIRLPNPGRVAPEYSPVHLNPSLLKEPSDLRRIRHRETPNRETRPLQLRNTLHRISRELNIIVSPDDGGHVVFTSEATGVRDAALPQHAVEDRLEDPAEGRVLPAETEAGVFFRGDFGPHVHEGGDLDTLFVQAGAEGCFDRL